MTAEQERDHYKRALEMIRNSAIEAANQDVQTLYDPTSIAETAQAYLDGEDGVSKSTQREDTARATRIGAAIRAGVTFGVMTMRVSKTAAGGAR